MEATAVTLGRNGALRLYIGLGVIPRGFTDLRACRCAIFIFEIDRIDHLTQE
jgi:hypothetical protein